MRNVQRKLYHVSHQKHYKTFMWYILVVMCVWLVCKQLYFLVSDQCGGHAHVKHLCDEYYKGNAAGDMCHQLCGEKVPFIQYCVKDVDGFRLFNHNHTTVTKVLLKHLDTASKNYISLDQDFRYPNEGANMDSFYNDLTAFVTDKLGPGNHKELIDRIILLGDLNRDSELSLGQARSLWSLLQINDFFITFIFTSSHHIPQLLGYCGDTYLVEYTPMQQLYKPIPKSKGVISTIFPNSHTWFWHSWELRVKLAIGLLELAVSAYQHGTEGMFYMCNVTESNIGYTFSFEPRLLELSYMIAKHDLGNLLKDRNCDNDLDCTYTPQCIASCDLSRHKCTAEVTTPSLVHICRIIRPFILPGAAKIMKGDLWNLFDRCEKLVFYTSDELPLQHSLVYTDMKSLLWRHISNTIA